MIALFKTKPYRASKGISKSKLFGIAKNKRKSYTKKYASALLAYATKSVKMYTVEELGALSGVAKERVKEVYYYAIQKRCGWMRGEMMEFEEILYRAKMDDKQAVEQIVVMYRPLLIKNALVDGVFDEDLYQELIIELLKCIRYYRSL